MLDKVLSVCTASMSPHSADPSPTQRDTPAMQNMRHTAALHIQPLQNGAALPSLPTAWTHQEWMPYGTPASGWWRWPGLAHTVKLDSPCSERGNMGCSAETLYDNDFESVYVNSCSLLPAGTMAIYQNFQRLEGANDLFYTSVMVNVVSLKGILIPAPCHVR